MRLDLWLRDRYAFTQGKRPLNHEDHSSSSHVHARDDARQSSGRAWGQRGSRCDRRHLCPGRPGGASRHPGDPAAVLSFKEAALGGAVSEGAALDTELRDGEDGEQKILSVEVSSTEAIGQGLLVTLTFEVSQEIAINHDIQLDNLSQSSKSLDGEDLRARGLGGSITSIEFIPACFFYMH